ncbi:MAG: cobyrinate a,c-diamide synthase [Deltaproteobacteria bacterium]|nr:cobyrinate a,c-diamide synthase [Deltaproteobacteria bacterium]MBW2133215.1 cobyrinate a,c-diamide synthase [Deltaproteobacteria bacterium]
MPWTWKKEGLIKGLVIAGTHSGCGKTTIALGIMSALRRRQLRVAPFKVGPDFIDPGFHAFAAGSQSRNLDGWMLSESYNKSLFAHCNRTADVAVVEGVMGLFDGYDGRSEAGSTAQMAKWLGLPVLLCVDARSMARSAAALVQGFERFDPDLSFAGVVFNNLGSRKHLEYLLEAVKDKVAMPCIGGLMREEGIRLNARHLGLVTLEDAALTEEGIRRMADTVEGSLDLDGLLRRLPDIQKGETSFFPAVVEKKRVRIGVARDRAFCFYYPDNLKLLEGFGAELVTFSPIRDSVLPEDIAGVYLGGGYPELAADALSRNQTLKDQLRRMSLDGMPIYGECGGFMYLCREIVDFDGTSHAMVGCFPFRARMHGRLRSLGYRKIELIHDTVIGPAGLCAKGHEFHYSDISKAAPFPEGRKAFRVFSRAGATESRSGFQVNRTLGSYIHLHFGSRPEAARHFVESCDAYQKEREKR